MNGGSGSSGGSGGRLAVYYGRSFFSGVMSSIGGVGVHLDGAAGTVFLSNVSSGLNTLKVYNRKTSTVTTTKANDRIDFRRHCSINTLCF